MSNFLVIGGGAAGMMAAYQAACLGHKVQIFEQNEKLGKKIFITGKGRCNVTNNCDPETFFENVVTNSKFLYSAYYGFDCSSTMEFFEESGIHLKTERGNRVFPVSDHSSDIIKGLESQLRKSSNVTIHLNTRVTGIKVADNLVAGIDIIKNNHKSFVPGENILIATGGNSYSSTGSTGDGYRFSEKLGLKVTEIRPALVPLEVSEGWIRELQGLSLKNIQITILKDNKKLYSEFGEMLFTHFGVSGPVILTGSSYISKHLMDSKLKLLIDLKPAIDKDTLDKRILREFEANNNKQFKNSLGSLFPSKLIPVITALSGIDGNIKVHDITRAQREAFVELIKAFPLTITGTRDFNEAIITQGGVSVKEISPSTMESKKIKGLYFAGEVLDLDAVTGGFNLQIAWSTGALAGRSVE